MLDVDETEVDSRGGGVAPGGKAAGSLFILAPIPGLKLDSYEDCFLSACCSWICCDTLAYVGAVVLMATYSLLVLVGGTGGGWVGGGGMPSPLCEELWDAGRGGGTLALL